MNYKPNKGGHAPGHLRDAFCEWIEEGNSSMTIKLDDEPKPLEWLLGQLWNCTDILPGTYCNELEIPQGSTYAMAVRKTKYFQKALSKLLEGIKDGGTKTTPDERLNELKMTFSDDPATCAFLDLVFENRNSLDSFEDDDIEIKRKLLILYGALMDLHENKN